MFALFYVFSVVKRRIGMLLCEKIQLSEIQLGQHEIRLHVAIDAAYDDTFWKWLTTVSRWILKRLLVSWHMLNIMWYFLFFLSISNILGIKSHCSLAFSFYLEYNPKLSEATQTTRVAYVKFMAHAMRRESNADADTETKEVDMNKVRKSILRTASKASAVWNTISIIYKWKTTIALSCWVIENLSILFFILIWNRNVLKQSSLNKACFVSIYILYALNMWNSIHSLRCG